MLSTKDFQQTILSNGGEIIDNISSKEIEEYHFIKDHLHSADVRASKEFQEHFSNLHELKRKRLDSKLMDRVFEVLENQKDNGELNIRQISRKVFGIRPKRYKPKHFSLLTRLMHTVHENYPIYDRNVAEVFNDALPQKPGMPFFRKLNIYFTNYDHLIQVYRESLNSGKLYDLLRAIELKFKPYKHSLNQSKNLDLVVRSAGDLKKKGRLVSPSSYIF